ncbi:MAG: response regulator [bacterium]|nr:response regulator [bacterium]
MNTKRILVVDDEPDICEILSRFLKEHGYEVKTAYNGKSAIEITKEFSPHYILLDIIMPEMSGLETLREIREIDSHVTVLMITALHDLSVARDAIKIGATDYITKPIDLKYLADFLYEHSHRQ